MKTGQEVLSILRRERHMFDRDLEAAESELTEGVRGRSFLVLGGAGSIGQAVVKAIIRRRPRRLHVVDLSENNLVELVRDVRSSHRDIEFDFQTLPLDCGGLETEIFLKESAGTYEFMLNLSAMKHVRSEKDGLTLMRMIRTNVLNTEKLLRLAADIGIRRFFSVSSDKAVNPANAMGATKRLMELCLIRASRRIEVSSARFANVAFSDGSLLHGFTLRLAKRQPLSAPEDVRRYFITTGEAADLCLLSCILSANREAFFPKLRDDFQAMDFRSIAERFLESHGYLAYPCATEDEARCRVEELAANGLWPCHFFTSDTTGEKPIEEFYMANENIDLDRYQDIGVIGWEPLEDEELLDRWLRSLREAYDTGRWTRKELLEGLGELLPEFRHRETGKFLDVRM